jgi:hypothetical protein
MGMIIPGVHLMATEGHGKDGVGDGGASNKWGGSLTWLCAHVHVTFDSELLNNVELEVFPLNSEKHFNFFRFA